MTLGQETLGWIGTTLGPVPANGLAGFLLLAQFSNDSSTDYADSIQLDKLSFVLPNLCNLRMPIVRHLFSPARRVVGLQTLDTSEYLLH